MKLEDVVEIDADPGLVWAVTVDVERWAEWTPTVTSIRRLDDGPFTAGSRALIKQPGLPETEWRVTELVERESFTWRARVRGMRIAGTHEITPTGAATRSLLRIEVSGFGAWVVGPLLKPALARSLRQENAGLKARCEQP